MMDEQEAFAAFDHEVLTDRGYAHILLEHPQSGACLGRARAIMVSLGGAIVEERQVPPKWIIVKLAGGDIRDAALKLAESGYLVLKGANSLQR
jgi:hypothetical protein